MAITGSGAAVTGAAAAAGSVSPNFQPSSLSNLVAWYDAADAASLSISSGLVNQWNDKSSNANHVSQAGALRPSYSPTGLDSLHPGVTFSGSTYLQSSGLPFTAIPSSTVFVVFSNGIGTDFQYFYGLGSFGDDFAVGRQSSSLLMSVLSHAYNGTSGLAPQGATRYGTWLYDGSSGATSWRSNSVMDPASSGTLPLGSVGSSLTYVGGIDDNYRGTISEIIVYSELKSETDIAAVQAYLYNKWELAQDLGSGSATTGGVTASGSGTEKSVGAGSVTGAGSSAATGKSTAVASGAAAGAAQSQAGVINRGTGTAAGAGSIAAAGLAPKITTGTVAGSATVAAAGTAVKIAAGNITASAAVAAQGTGINTATGAAAGAAHVSPAGISFEIGSGAAVTGGVTSFTSGPLKIEGEAAAATAGATAAGTGVTTLPPARKKLRRVAAPRRRILIAYPATGRRANI